MFCGMRDFIYRIVEDHFICVGWFAEAAQFANELHSRGADFVGRGGRLKIMQSLNVSAHAGNPAALLRARQCKNVW